MILSHTGRSHEADIYYYESDTSGKIYEVNISDKGFGHHFCTCPAWAIKRNKNGGTGAPSHCKHIDAVIAQRDKEVDVSKTSLGSLLAEIESL